MSSIEPGEKFKVGYGKGHELEVVALSLRKKRLLLQRVETIQGGKGAEAFDAIEDALRIVKPDITDDELDRLDEVLAMEVITNVMSQNQVSEDESKKSE